MLRFSEITQLKQELAEKYNVALHYHDICPKAFFSLERNDSHIQEYSTEFLKARNYTPRFYEDGLQFTV